MISEEWESASHIWEGLVRVDRGGIVRRAVEEKERREGMQMARSRLLPLCLLSTSSPTSTSTSST